MWVFMALYTYISAAKHGAKAQPWTWRPGDMGYPAPSQWPVYSRFVLGESWWEHGGQSQGMNYQLSSVVSAQGSRWTPGAPLLLNSALVGPVWSQDGLWSVGSPNPPAQVWWPHVEAGPHTLPFELPKLLSSAESGSNPSMSPVWEAGPWQPAQAAAPRGAGREPWEVAGTSPERKREKCCCCANAPGISYCWLIYQSN